ncbi:MAG: TetR/AcrR family transcriptional regulator [Streptosporangiales bacterium]|nr:TetR/AcrR family transcriptional regulator [Streptosporangiales bacterium]
MTTVVHLLAPQPREPRQPRKPSPGAPGETPPRESLRERKKRLTREALFAEAARLFGERGFEDVTVAEIADAANVSVKTLFTYVRSKEELLFGGGPTVLDAVVAAVAGRRVGQTPLVAAANALLAAVGDGRLEDFQRLADAGPAARSRLRELAEEAEDALTLVLAGRGDGLRDQAARRLVAAQIMVLVRATASAEVRALAAEAGPGRRQREERLADWIRDAAGNLARGLAAAGR